MTANTYTIIKYTIIDDADEWLSPATTVEDGVISIDDIEETLNVDSTDEGIEEMAGAICESEMEQRNIIDRDDVVAYLRECVTRLHAEVCRVYYVDDDMEPKYVVARSAAEAASEYVDDGSYPDDVEYVEVEVMQFPVGVTMEDIDDDDDDHYDRRWREEHCPRTMHAVKNGNYDPALRARIDGEDEEA